MSIRRDIKKLDFSISVQSCTKFDPLSVNSLSLCWRLEMGSVHANEGNSLLCPRFNVTWLVQNQQFLRISLIGTCKIRGRISHFCTFLLHIFVSNHNNNNNNNSNNNSVFLWGNASDHTKIWYHINLKLITSNRATILRVSSSGPSGGGAIKVRRNEIAEEPDRWDRTSACKGGLLQPLQFMFWSHLAHPDRWRPNSDRQWHRGLRPLPFSNNVKGSFMSSFNWSTRMKETRPTA